MEDNKPYGYIVEESWQFRTGKKNKEDNEITWGEYITVPWTLMFKKKFYKLKESALDAIKQTHKLKNHKFRIIPLYIKDEIEEICINEIQ